MPEMTLFEDVTTGGYAEVAVDSPGHDAYTYGVPAALRTVLQVGDSVTIPYGHRRERGFIIARHDEPPPAGIRIKDILARQEGVRLPPALLKLIRWGATYYRCHLGAFLAAAVPGPVREGVAIRPQRFICRIAGDTPALSPRQEEVLDILGDSRLEFAALCRLAGCSRSVVDALVRKGIVELNEERVVREPHLKSSGEHFPLTAEQTTAVTAVEETLAAGTHQVFLLYGVTGSGKTLVYMELAARVIASGRQVLMLLPEIALTPQLAGRFRARFGRVAVWHSAFSAGERAEQWRRVSTGEVDLVIGTRSGLFAPLPDPGLIIVDEEHDQSYKQDRTPRYHGRDLAVVYAAQLGVPVILGSATPSLETYQNASSGRYRALSLRERPGGATLPSCEVVDMRIECQQVRRSVQISRRLVAELDRARREGRQGIVMLNRRGWSPVVTCLTCGHGLECKRCAITLTWHRGANALCCHYCGYREAMPRCCPNCGRPDLSAKGVGTEQLEMLLRDAVPGLRTLRLDADTVGHGRTHAQILQRFARREADCLVGTQMVAKGLDFPDVTVVGIVGADKGLAVPDFRSSERTFQLVTQVSGRAGRAQHPGVVIVQAFDTEAPAIVHAIRGQTRRFYQHELALRDEYGYPPCGGLVRILWTGEHAVRVQSCAEEHGKRLRDCLAGEVLLGPTEADLSRLQGRTRWHALIKAGSRGGVQAFLDRVHQAGDLPGPSGILVQIDVDPYFTM